MDPEIKKAIDEIIRVNHAGEYGAQKIYNSQIRFSVNKNLKNKLKKIAKDEKRHFDYFEKKMIENRTRPTVMSPIWDLGGTVLGAITAKLGEKYVDACTEAVEQEIVEHYKTQINFLKKKKIKGDLLNKIKKFCDEEDEHRKNAQSNINQNGLGVNYFKRFTKNLTKLAIKISKKY